MRDPDRLDSVYDRIKELHKEHLPDWRVSQLFNNFFSWHIARTRTDGFYLEEDAFLERFEDFIDYMCG